MKTRKGLFVFCVDVELAWGIVHRRRIDLRKFDMISRRVRKILDEVTGLVEKYQIPTTWAILGHVVLKGCKCEDGIPHRRIPRAEYSWLNGDWYKYDPCSTVELAPAWYGKDLIDRLVNYVVNSRIPHDIACHSFSHQMFGDPDCPKEVAVAEIEKCLEIMKEEYDLVPEVFTFPRDYVGHLDVLKENGFVAFRDTIPKLYPCLKLKRTISNVMNTSFSSFVQGLSYYMILSPHVTSPRLTHGIWGILGSLGYSKKQLIPFKLVTYKAIRGIAKAVRRRRIFCLTTHLHDLASSKNILSDFEKILSYANKERMKGNLCVKTIRQVVTELKNSNVG